MLSRNPVFLRDVLLRRTPQDDRHFVPVKRTPQDDGGFMIEDFRFLIWEGAGGHRRRRLPGVGRSHPVHRLTHKTTLNLVQPLTCPK